MRVLNCFKRYWFWLLLAFLLLYLLTLLPLAGNKWRSIEHDVASRITQSLTQAGHQWPQIQTKDRGRDVLITGQAPTEAAKVFVLELAKKTTDQRGHLVASSVTWTGTIVPVILQAPTFSVDLTANQVVLQGELANQDQIDDLLLSANNQYGADRVVNRLTVGEKLKPLERLNQLLTDFELDQAKLTFQGQSLTLHGQTSTAKLKSDAGQLMASKLGEDYIINNAIDVITPDPVFVEVFDKASEVNNICQTDLSSLMKQNTILFASSQAKIKQQSYAVLDQVISVLKQCPDASIEVTGHTDNTGKRYNNLILSEKRAQAVVNYLIQKDIDKKKLNATGMGSTQPIADNKTPSGRAKNRRIEFTIK